MRCIFCKLPSDNSVSVEHILPESLGNRSHFLPAGVVCDSCNNYFARKVEKPVLDSGYFTSLRFLQAIPNKKGSVPIQKALMGHNARLGPNVKVELVHKEDGPLTICIPKEHWDSIASMKTGEIVFPTSGPPPDPTMMSRFLAKVALEAMAARLLESDDLFRQLIDDDQLDPLRNWARRGSSVKNWAFHERVIYDQNQPHVDETGQTFQCLNEYDFLATKRHELYFCLVVFGVEYTINIGGSSLDGYMEWLREHDDASPLYTPKEKRDAD